MSDNPVETYISDGNITLFFGLHTNTFKEDILNSSLLGQLVANVNSTTTDTWFHSYKKTLSSIFWTTKSNAIQNPNVRSASLLKLARLSLSNHLSPTELDQLAQSLSHVKELPVDCAAMAALLNKIQPADPNENPPTITTSPLLTIVREDKMIISFIISLETTNPVGVNIIDEELPLKKASSPPQISQWVTYFLEDNYASVRNRVIEKLGSKIKTKLFHIESSQT